MDCFETCYTWSKVLDAERGKTSNRTYTANTTRTVGLTKLRSGDKADTKRQSLLISIGISPTISISVNVLQVPFESTSTAFAGVVVLRHHYCKTLHTNVLMLVGSVVGPSGIKMIVGTSPTRATNAWCTRETPRAPPGIQGPILSTFGFNLQRALPKAASLLGDHGMYAPVKT